MISWRWCIYGLNRKSISMVRGTTRWVSRNAFLEIEFKEVLLTMVTLLQYNINVLSTSYLFIIIYNLKRDRKICLLNLIIAFFCHYYNPLIPTSLALLRSNGILWSNPWHNSQINLEIWHLRNYAIKVGVVLAR